jgi:hypothetical protein
MKSHALVAALAVAGALVTSAAQAQNVQVGTLTCDVAGGVGLVLGSRKDVVCTYQNAAGGTEIYDGSISKLGVDIGVTGRSVIVWNVFAPSGQVVHGALSGSYVGATAQATLGAGVGANALIGGSRRSIALQPVSVSAQEGVNVAAGAADLTLRLRPEERPRRGHRSR